VGNALRVKRLRLTEREPRGLLRRKKNLRYEKEGLGPRGRVERNMHDQTGGEKSIEKSGEKKKINPGPQKKGGVTKKPTHRGKRERVGQ